VSELVVFTYRHADRADEVLRHISQLKREHVQKPLIGVEDAAVAVRSDDGRVRIRQTMESAVKGGRIASGGLWGVLLGIFFGGPLLGALAGLGVGALLGRRVDIGIDNTFIDDVSSSLEPGDSVLFLLVRDTPIDTLAETLNAQGGRLFHTSLSDEAAAAFTQASEYEEVRLAFEQERED
jgi:uncharacterized membrane protein